MVNVKNSICSSFSDAKQIEFYRTNWYRFYVLVGAVSTV